MAMKTPATEPPTFEVTCVIGRVTVGHGEHSPEEAAMLLIGRHGAEGEYHFPLKDGRDCVVTVEHQQEGNYAE